MSRRQPFPFVYLGADHGGYQRKQQLCAWLRRHGIRFIDLGALKLRLSDDYPRYARAVALSVRRHPGSRGILLCRSGVGMALAANKVPSIRAVQGWSVGVAVRSRKEEDSNVLSLAGDTLARRQLISIVRRWLTTSFRPLRRYQRRLRQVSRLEHGRP